ncbi:efflux RND transporter periplasmic adaptor subunit [Candidatus Beckwithbacteria bacterium]|nr:efflux RND transporter periplasmic adaptor subunit [Candidatus Beckwithbacteria bacterium]
MNKIFAWFWNHKFRSIILLLIIGAVIFYVIKKNQPPKVETATVSKGEITSIIEASGQVMAQETADLTFSATGKIAWVGVKKGDQISRWQALASLDQRELQKQLKKALLTQQTTRNNFENTIVDYDYGISSVNNYDIQTRGDEDLVIKRLLINNQISLDSATLDVEIADLARDYATLISPISGTVVNDGSLKPGQWLTAANLSSKAIRITDLSTLYFQANIDEADYANIQIGQAVIITLDSFPDKKINGTVTFIGKEGVKKTGGSVQIPIDIAMTNAPLGVVTELNGDVNVILQKKNNVLKLDKTFVHKEDDKYSVNILDNNKVISRPVKIGLIGPDNYEIISGLAEGDQVVNVVK